jgi:CubicO group peptidase (beta-lactamase class C family)
MERRADPDRSAKIDKVVQRSVGRDEPGLAIAVIRDGDVVHLAGYGLANLEAKAPVTPRTTFHMASTAKQFTGLGIMMLHEAGALRYDDHIGRHIPELAGFPPGVTIRRLLHHLAGVREFYSHAASRSALRKLSQQPVNEDVIRLYARLGFPMGGTAGKDSYSNAGYDLLGCVIERVSGQSFREFFRTRVFAPVGMTDTFSLPDQKRLASARCAITYTGRFDAPIRRDSDPFDGICGAGSIYSSVADLCRYEAALASNRLVTAATMRVALTSAVRASGTETGYGFGWRLHKTYAAHAGEWNGFESYIRRYRNRRLSVYVLANRSRPDPFKIGDIAARAFL